MSQAAQSGKKTFSCELPAELLDAMFSMAKSEGTEFRILLEDAVRQYLSQKSAAPCSESVREALAESIGQHDDLYRMLAK